MTTGLFVKLESPKRFAEPSMTHFGLRTLKASLVLAACGSGCASLSDHSAPRPVAATHPAQQFMATTAPSNPAVNTAAFTTTETMRSRTFKVTVSPEGSNEAKAEVGTLCGARLVAASEGEPSRSVVFRVRASTAIAGAFQDFSEDEARIMLQVLDRFLAIVADKNSQRSVERFKATVGGPEWRDNRDPVPYQFDLTKPAVFALNAYEVDLPSYRSALIETLADIDALKKVKPVGEP